ncbi:MULTISPECIES: AraC family transcriptional regulator [Streptomyces]|uniref:AraC family transcriptional regulator n=1 Tax=Streptomyces solicathayae TaxID=3081768 RepID=A0ABZ0M2Y9_9ACTN|nr:AraC family transcriptional regulator [Streptomyces sp. HUAS YS2]WOX26097.1 AraC family transcriptional regulator [Streptomyces sp. HUAS YS2]
MTPALDTVHAAHEQDPGMPPRSVSMHHVRAVLLGAERQGIPVAPLLEQAGIAAESLDEDRARVSPERFSRLVRALWATMEDELVGFGRLPSKVGTFAMMGHAVVHGSADLRSAIRRAQAFYALFPAGPRFRLVEPAGADERAAAVEFDVSDYEDPLHFGTETTLAVAHRFASWLIRRRIALRRLEFAYPAPPHVLEYDLLFGAPCVFDAPRTAVVFDRALLGEPVVQDAADLKAFLRRAPCDILARIDYGGTLAARVRRLLGQALPGALPAPEAVAERLSVSPQTLRRRLAAEGTSFQQVRDHLRRDHAIAALAGGTASIEELSHRLGFSEPSAFHRAFRRWTGSTPRSYGSGPESIRPSGTVTGAEALAP